MNRNINMVSEIQTWKDPSGILRDIEWDKESKPKGHESILEETRPDHAISSTVTSTKLPLCCKKKMLNFFLFLTFWLSYCS